jgi:RND family efflux transporter MFP subunit
MKRSLQLGLSLLSLTSLDGCGGGHFKTAPQPPPQVSTATVLSREVSDTAEFSGRFRAVSRVEIRPRVSGYILSSPFKEGTEVKQGDVLFVIEPRPYQAAEKLAQAELTRARDQLALASLQHVRANKLLAQNAIAREEFEALASASEQAGANVKAAEAALDTATLNLQYTRVTSPISGVVSRQEINPGNLVTADQTLLTTVVSIDPIYVEFDSDESSYLKYFRQARQSNRTAPTAVEKPIAIGLTTETGYPHTGVMAFVNNELDLGTGTIHVRGRLSNGAREFTPGMFARIKVSGASKYVATLVNDDAIGTDQNIRFVYVLSAADMAEYRVVRLGPLIDGLRVVSAGLKPGETIILDGLQRVHPGSIVNPQRTVMENSDEDPAADHGTITDVAERAP